MKGKASRQTVQFFSVVLHYSDISLLIFEDIANAWFSLVLIFTMQLTIQQFIFDLHHL